MYTFAHNKKKPEISFSVKYIYFIIGIKGGAAISTHLRGDVSAIQCTDFFQVTSTL